MAPSVIDSSANHSNSWIDRFEQHARLDGQRQAVVEVDERGQAVVGIRWDELAQRSHEHRAQIRQSGAPNHHTLMLVLPSGIEYLTWLHAGLTAGLRVVPVHPQAVGTEIERAIRATGASLLVRQRSPDEPGVISLIEPATQGSSTPGATPRGPAVILSSSGTTGLPKHVLREGAALEAVARNVTLGMGLSRADTLLAAMPLCHSYGIDVLLAAWHAGCAMHIPRAMTPAALSALVRESATVIPGLPFLYELLLREPPGRSSVRLCLSAGSPLPERLRRSVEDVWKLRIGQLYGATELGTVAMADPVRVSDAASIGPPLPGVEFRVLDPTALDRTVPHGACGVLAVKATSMLTRYLDDEMESRDGFWLSGDLAVQDDQGLIKLVGRQKLLIDVGGYKVNPLEVEAAILEHPGIAACVVVPMNASDTVQRARAVCVARDTLNPPADSDMRAFLRARLSPTKVPRLIEFAPNLPRTATGKILRDQVARSSSPHP